ncbi:hypothetical protein NDA13_002495 [Ustilago tritici]|nr:hypothetical protein NDA13_002495 [Ustilago tritici]
MTARKSASTSTPTKRVEADSTTPSPTQSPGQIDRGDSPEIARSTAGSDVADRDQSTSPTVHRDKRQRFDDSTSAATTTFTDARPGPLKGTKRKAKYIPNRIKRYHERSLAGCLTCRKRRVKCDEGRPVCRRCSTGDRECIYAESSASSSSSQAVQTSQPSALTSSSAGSSSPNLPGIQVSSLLHPSQPAKALDATGSASGLASQLSPPEGVGAALFSRHSGPFISTSPQSPLDEHAANSSHPHAYDRTRASTSTHHDRYRTANDSSYQSDPARHASSQYDHHRPQSHYHFYRGSFASSSIDISKVKLPELPPGLGFDHLDAYFPTYEQQCLFRHYILEVASQLCVIRIPLSDNRWIRYHATFAVRHPHGTNGYEDALRSALLSMASLDIGHKLSQEPIPDLFPAVASRPEDPSPISEKHDHSTSRQTGPPLTNIGQYQGRKHGEYNIASSMAGLTDPINDVGTKSNMSNVLLELSNLRREESLRLLRTTLKERRAPLDRSNAAIMLATVLGLATRDRLAAQQDWQDALHIASRAIAELGGPAAFVDQSDPSSLFLIEQIACFDALSSLTSDDYTLFLQPWDDWWYALMDSPRSIKEDSVLQTFGLHRGMIDMLARMTRVEATRRELQERTSVTIILSETVGGGSPPALPPEYEETRLWLESTARALVAEIPIWAKMPFPAEATRTLQTLLPVIMNHLYVAAAELYIHSVIFSKPADHPCFAEPTAVVLNRSEEAIRAGITKGLVLPLSFAAFSARHQDCDRIRAMFHELRPYYKFDLERMEKLNEHLWSLVDSGLTPTDWGLFLKSVGCFNWAF